MFFSTCQIRYSKVINGKRTRSFDIREDTGIKLLILILMRKQMSSHHHIMRDVMKLDIRNNDSKTQKRDALNHISFNDVGLTI